MIPPLAFTPTPRPVLPPAPVPPPAPLIAPGGCYPQPIKILPIGSGWGR